MRLLLPTTNRLCACQDMGNLLAQSCLEVYTHHLEWGAAMINQVCVAVDAGCACQS